jgi:hypothetical protein
MGSIAIDPGAVDPITGRTIQTTDPHYNVLSIYYRLIPQYQHEIDEALDGLGGYLTRVWHDYAVLLLQTAEALNITVRPPGFKAAPTPPTVHKLALTPAYQLQITLVPACAIPPDPDPAKMTLRAIPLAHAGDDQQYEIVPITAAGRGTSLGTGGTGSGIAQAPSKEQIIAWLKAMSNDDRMAVVSAALVT